MGNPRPRRKRDAFAEAPTPTSRLKSELAFRKDFVHDLRSLNACPVENTAGPGTPDVNYVDGWIELKCIDKWPVRAGGIVRCDHFRTGQRAWLVNRRACGGRVFVLLYSPSNTRTIILPGAWAATRLGYCDEATLHAAALYDAPYFAIEMLRFFHSHNSKGPP